MTPIVLASASPFRRKMLEDAGIAFEVDSPEVDERAVETAVEGSGVTPEELAAILAEAKAIDVSASHPGALVIGCDQTLSLGDAVLHRPTWRRRAAGCSCFPAGRTSSTAPWRSPATRRCCGGMSGWRG